MPIRNNFNTLEVPDSGIWKEFLAHARKIWTAAHPEAVGRRRRPSEQKRVSDACDKICQDREGKCRLTEGHFIQAVEENLGPQAPH